MQYLSHSSLLCENYYISIQRLELFYINQLMFPESLWCKKMEDFSSVNTFPQIDGHGLTQQGVTNCWACGMVGTPVCYL